MCNLWLRIKLPKQITIRFYEELNDFLPKPHRKKPIEHTFFGTPTLRDIIESLGIPHTEVDLILANSQPAEFSYKPAGGDYISVYPKFETFDISTVTQLNPRPLRIIKFILDVHLGKLAHYLRMLGFDTLYRNNLDDPEIIDIALKEHRIILTRDKQLLKNGKVTHGYYVRSENPLVQIREVIGRFDLKHSAIPFSRCIECNGELEKITFIEAEPFLEEGTKENFDQFYRCKNCRRIYWEGSHYDRMVKLVEGLVGGRR